MFQNVLKTLTLKKGPSKLISENCRKSNKNVLTIICVCDLRVHFCIHDPSKIVLSTAMPLCSLVSFSLTYNIDSFRLFKNTTSPVQILLLVSMNNSCIESATKVHDCIWLPIHKIP